MQLTCDVQKTHIAAFTLHLYDTQPAYRRSVRKTQLWVALFTVAYIVAMALLGASVAFLITMAIIFSLYILFIDWRHRKRIVKNTMRLYEDGKNITVFGRHSYRLDRETFVDETPNGQSPIKLRAVERVDTTDSATYVLISALAAFVIPKETVISGDYDTFVSELTRLWKEAQARVPGE